MTHTALSRLTLAAGLPLLGLGVVSSCASSPTRSPTPAVVAPAPAPRQGEDTATTGGDGERTLSTDGHDDPGSAPAHSTESDDRTPGAGEIRDAVERESEHAASVSETKALLEELKSLYRRLHIELPPDRRSELIVELLNDRRTELRILGFELADRDLSASIPLGEDVSQTVHDLIDDPNPLIRARAARLITRLVPPDAMIVITNALVTENDPTAAEPMLLGIARWPNEDAKGSVLRWLARDDAPVFACFSAAWAIENMGLWDPERDHPVILDRLRRSGPHELREDGMKLLARLGSASDLHRIVGFMLSSDAGVVRWAASALVETPRAVDILAQGAEENEALYRAAAEALIKHRPMPEGMRRLAEIPISDAGLRREMLLRMGRAIDQDQLGEAVKLAQLDPEMTIAILSRLVGTEEPHSARSARGVLQLAQLQLDAGRPNRVIEALLSLDGVTLEPVDRDRLMSMRTQALILLGRYDEAAEVSLSYRLWSQAIERANDEEQRARIARHLLNRDDAQLNEEQRAALRAYLPDEEGAEQQPG